MTQGSSAALVPAPQRGRLKIELRVLEKVAAQAAGEISGAGGNSGGFLGIGTQHDLDARPKVSVDLRGGIADVSVTCGLSYPTPLRETADAVRRHVAEQLTRLVGVEVGRIDIDVAWLARGGTDSIRGGADSARRLF